jgi:hypothetical protein
VGPVSHNLWGVQCTPLGTSEDSQEATEVQVVPSGAETGGRVDADPNPNSREEADTEHLDQIPKVWTPAVTLR